MEDFGTMPLCAPMSAGAPNLLDRYGARRCHAFGCKNARIPNEDSVDPMPECLRPVQGRRGLTRSQQFQ
jgi:hypothetical protein